MNSVNPNQLFAWAVEHGWKEGFTIRRGALAISAGKHSLPPILKVATTASKEGREVRFPFMQEDSDFESELSESILKISEAADRPFLDIIGEMSAIS